MAWFNVGRRREGPWRPDKAPEHPILKEEDRTGKLDGRQNVNSPACIGVRQGALFDLASQFDDLLPGEEDHPFLPRSESMDAMSTGDRSGSRVERGFRLGSGFPHGQVFRLPGLKLYIMAGFSFVNALHSELDPTRC